MFSGCSFNIVNNGPDALFYGPFVVDYFLSDDTVFGDADDRKIGDISVTASIASGSTLSTNLASAGLVAMTDEWAETLVPNGNYYVWARVRFTSSLQNDAVPGNDYARADAVITYTGETVHSDLAVTGLSASRSSSAARAFSGCSISIANNGPDSLSLEPLTVDFFLSEDTVFGDADDRKIGDISVTESIASGATLSAALNASMLGYMTDEWIPTLVPNGIYYLWARVRFTRSLRTDATPGNDYTRANSAFNYAGEPVGCDLAVTSLSVSRTLSSACTFTGCSLNIVNNGPVALSLEPLVVDFYLSDDSTFGDADDRKIGDVSITLSGAAGAANLITLNSEMLGYMTDEWIPTLVPNGNYYVWAKVGFVSSLRGDPIPGNDYARSSLALSYTGNTTKPWDNGAVPAPFGGGWMRLDWFGYYNVAAAPPWIGHETHGWLYPIDDGAGGVWLYDWTQDAWWWTSSSAYPWMWYYNDPTGQWMGYKIGSYGPRYFYNLNTQQWEAWQP